MKRVLSFFFAAVIICLFIAQVYGQDKRAENPPQTPKTDGEKKDDCGCDSEIPPEVLAIVGGVKVTFKDIDASVGSQIQELREQVIRARKQELHLLINSNLLEMEAKKRGTTPNALLQAEVFSKITEPAEAEAQIFYDQNRAQLQGEFKDLKDSIIAYMRSQRQKEEAQKFVERLRAAADVKILVEDIFPPADEAGRARVLAMVNKVSITSGELEDSLKPLIFDAQERIYNLRQRQIDLRINDILLEQEAKKRNITPAALLEAEVTPKLKKITDADAEKFYAENRATLQGAYVEIKDKIIEYLTAVERDRAETEFANHLRKGVAIQVFLKEPEQPVYRIAVDDQPSKGGANAQVTIIEFTDYECPACAAAHPLLEGLVKEYGDRVKLVVRDFPLEQHTHAAKAAEAAEAAREQGKYWEYIALLFQNQGMLKVENLKEYATLLQLDRKRFDEALDSGKHAEKVQRDQRDGFRAGVDATPTVFINGRRIKEKTRENLKAAIEAALKEVAKK
ncbi:MAG: DsbA family protein [Blastocatellia bacterium]|nr:DsbA family protein [Blastocatellia bacterium]